MGVETGRMKLTKRQLLVAEALYSGRMTEGEILERYQLRSGLFRRWQGSEAFRGELERLSGESLRKMRYIVTSYGPMAALRLAELISAEKPDGTRRAALELYFRCLGQLQGVDEVGAEKPDGDNRWSDEQARSMVRELARGFE